jgi:hypothetical protein
MMQTLQQHISASKKFLAKLKRTVGTPKVTYNMPLEGTYSKLLII